MINYKDYINAPYGAFKKAVEAEKQKKPTKIVLIGFIPMNGLDIKDIIDSVDRNRSNFKQKMLVYKNDALVAKAWKTKHQYTIKGTL